MERLLLTVLAVALLGCGTAEAQMTSLNPSRTLPVRRPSPTLMTAPSPMAVPGTVTAGSATPGGPGTVQLYLGILAPFPGTSLGGIAICPATGIIGYRRGKWGDGERRLDVVAIVFRRRLQCFDQLTTYRPATADHESVRHDHDVQLLHPNGDHDRSRYVRQHRGPDADQDDGFDADQCLGR